MAGIAKRIVYLSFDGILQPLGWSQVARMLCALTAPSRAYRLVSLEREADLADTQRAAQARRTLLVHDIAWDPIVYREGGAAVVSRNVMRARRSVRNAIKEHNANLVHARGYQSGWVARSMKRSMSVPYVFDFRGYWIDERRDARRWFSTQSAYKIAKHVEHGLFQDADAVVSLTELAADDVRKGTFGTWPRHKPVVTIPTCADYEAFVIPENKLALRKQVLPELGDKTLFGFVGSVNVSYRLQAALELFAGLERRIPSAHLLCVTQNAAPMRAAIANAGLHESSCTVRSFSHARMPEVVPCIDWGLVLLNTTYAKRASMPTKLAEFFASGVRPIAQGCNDEFLGWVRRASSGVAIERSQLDPAAVAASIKNAEATSPTLARSRTEPHFSLRSGVARYADLLDSI